MQSGLNRSRFKQTIYAARVDKVCDCDLYIFLGSSSLEKRKYITAVGAERSKPSLLISTST